MGPILDLSVKTRWISSVCNGILRFTSDATPADLLAAGIARSFVQALVGLESRIERAAASQYVTRETLCRLTVK